MSSPSVEAAHPTDAVAIARIEAEAASTRWSMTAVADTLAVDTTHAWIARANGGVVGHLLTRVAASTAEVLTIAVLADFRRGGLASSMLRRSEEAWKRAGVLEGFLEVRASNSGARALYRQHRWEQVGARKGYYADGEDAVVMRWEPTCG